MEWAWLAYMGVMVDPVYPVGWFRVESSHPFTVGIPDSHRIAYYHDDKRNTWVYLGATWLVAPVVLEHGASVCVWFGTEPDLCMQTWRPADTDRSGVVDSADISAFLTLWVQSTSGLHPMGDFDADFDVDSDDISAYIAAWGQG